MESLVNDLSNALANTNTSLLIQKSTLNRVQERRRKPFSLKKCAAKNLRLCHTTKRKKKVHLANASSSLRRENVKKHHHSKNSHHKSKFSSHHHHHHKHRNHQKPHRHQRHNSSIRSSSLNKHRHIMTLLIAARASIEAKTKKSMKITLEKGKSSSSNNNPDIGTSKI